MWSLGFPAFSGIQTCVHWVLSTTILKVPSWEGERITCMCKRNRTRMQHKDNDQVCGGDPTEKGTRPGENGICKMIESWRNRKSMLWYYIIFCRGKCAKRQEPSRKGHKLEVIVLQAEGSSETPAPPPPWSPLQPSIRLSHHQPLRNQVKLCTPF